VSAVRKDIDKKYLKEAYVTGGGHSDIDKITPTFYPAYD